MRENTRVCKYGACGFLLRKNGCSSPEKDCCSFFVTACVRIPLRTDCPGGHSRNTIEYYFIDR